MKMKRFFAIFAIIAVLCTFCTVTAMADGPEPNLETTHYKVGDTYKDGTITKVTNATCTTDGSVTYVKDGKDAVETIPATGHTFEKVVNKEATCTEGGTYELKCSVCGATNGETGVTAALGHDFSKVVDKENTCLEHTATHQCSRCDAVETEMVKGKDGKEVEQIKVYTLSIEKDHVYNEFVETKAATCTETGVKTATCQNCSAAKVEIIPALGHNYEIKESKVIDCTHVAVTYECEVCDEKTEGHKVSKTLDGVDAHQWVKDDKASTKATCLTDGEDVYVCSVCQLTKNVPVKAVGHHTWGDWTCKEVHSGEGDTATGWWVRTCTACGETETKFSKGKPVTEEPGAPGGQPADPPATPPAQEPDEPVADSYVIDGTAMTLTEKGVDGTGRIVPIGGDKIAESTVVRVAYILENADGTTGLYTTYAPLVDGNNFSLPGFDFPGITVKAACIVVVPDLANVQTATPETLSSIVKF